MQKVILRVVRRRGATSEIPLWGPDTPLPGPGRTGARKLSPVEHSRALIGRGPWAHICLEVAPLERPPLNKCAPMGRLLIHARPLNYRWCYFVCCLCLSAFFSCSPSGRRNRCLVSDRVVYSELIFDDFVSTSCPKFPLNFWFPFRRFWNLRFSNFSQLELFNELICFLWLVLSARKGTL